MALTSPDNIWTPDSSDNYALTTDLAATADSIQDALTKRANYGLGTTAEMNAALGSFPNGAMWFNTTNDTEYRRVGGSWVNQDTGWVTVPVRSFWTVLNTVQCRKVNSQVFWRGRVTPTAPISGTSNVVDAGGVPSWARPLNLYDTLKPVAANFTSLTAENSRKVAVVYEDGRLAVFMGPSSSDPVTLSALSGYIVD